MLGAVRAAIGLARSSVLPTLEAELTTGLGLTRAPSRPV